MQCNAVFSPHYGNIGQYNPVLLVQVQRKGTLHLPVLLASMGTLQGGAVLLLLVWIKDVPG